MGEIKLWQLIVIAAALVVLGGSAYLTLTKDKIEKADSMMLADVESGDLFQVKFARVGGVVIPAKNPDTGERTLVPVEQTDSGWIVPEFYRRALDGFDGAEMVKDAGSGLVFVREGSVRDFVRQ